MRVGHIELPVQDSRKALAFYRDVLGATIEAVQGDRYIWCRLFGLTILLNPDLPVASNPEKVGMNIVLYSNQVTKDMETLQSRGITFRCCRNCYEFEDPDGNHFQLVDPGEDHSQGTE